MFGNILDLVASIYTVTLCRLHRIFGGLGSVFASKVYFGNNATSFVESIILVSSYGVQFARQDSEFDAVELKNLLLDELFPYYQRLLETELGVLYLRHRGNSRYKSNPIHF